MEEESTSRTDGETSREDPTCGALARGFFRIGLTGFGGVGPIARDVIVERKRWLAEADYARLVGLCQVLPGANTVNVAVMIGDRFRGWKGAVLCVFALMLAPIAILVLLATAYAEMADQPIVRTALTGAAASAAGLVGGTAARMLIRLKPDWRQIATALAGLFVVSVLGWSLVTTLLVIGPIALLSRFAKRAAA